MMAAALLAATALGTTTLMVKGSRKVHDSVLFHGASSSHRTAATIELQDWWLPVPQTQDVLHVRKCSQKTLLQHNKKVILYCHGNSGNLDDAAYHVGFLQSVADVIVFDYRGYGNSTGTCSETHLKEDAETVLQELIRRNCYDAFYVYGRSLGAYPASFLATKYKLKGLILETPLTSCPEIAPSSLRSCYQVGLFPTLSVKEHLQKAQAAQKIPFYIALAERDEVIPLVGSEHLVSELAEPCTVFRFPCYHNEMADLPQYQEWILPIFV